MENIQHTVLGVEINWNKFTYFLKGDIMEFNNMYIVMLNDLSDFYYDIPVLVEANSEKEAKIKVLKSLSKIKEKYKEAVFEISHIDKLNDLIIIN